MGQSFTAFLGHTLNTNQLYILIEDLNSGRLSNLESLVNELNRLNLDDQNKLWVLNTNSIGGTFELNGPSGFDLRFSNKVCYIHHYIRWNIFISDKEIQLKLRRAIYDLAQYFGSTCAIYLPDNDSIGSNVIDFIWEEENKSIDFIIDWLNIECGEPRSEFKIYEQKESYSVYFIDFFNEI